MITQNQRLAIYDPDEPTVVWQGILERFDGIGRDDVTKTIPCRIVIDEPVIKTDLGLRALVRGMYVKCRVEVQTSTDADEQNLVTFPAVAIQPNNQAWIVKDRKLHPVDVEIEDRTEKTIDGKVVSMVVARTGAGKITVNDAVVVSPLSQPTEGAPVLLKEDAGAVNSDLPGASEKSKSSAGVQGETARPKTETPAAS